MKAKIIAVGCHKGGVSKTTTVANLGSMPIQGGVAMLAGVWYAGWAVDVFSRLIGPKQ